MPHTANLNVLEHFRLGEHCCQRQPCHLTNTGQFPAMQDNPSTKIIKAEPVQVFRQTDSPPVMWASA